MAHSWLPSEIEKHDQYKSVRLCWNLYSINECSYLRTLLWEKKPRELPNWLYQFLFEFGWFCFFLSLNVESSQQKVWFFFWKKLCDQIMYCLKTLICPHISFAKWIFPKYIETNQRKNDQTVQTKWLNSWMCWLCCGSNSGNLVILKFQPKFHFLMESELYSQN